MLEPLPLPLPNIQQTRKFGEATERCCSQILLGLRTFGGSGTFFAQVIRNVSESSFLNIRNLL